MAGLQVTLKMLSKICYEVTTTTKKLTLPYAHISMS